MRRFVRGTAYARMKLVSAALVGACGVALVVRTLVGVGLAASAIPAYVLGLAMVALGVVRYRDYFAATRAQR